MAQCCSSASLTATHMSHRRPLGKTASDSRAIIKKGAQGVRDRGKNAKETALILPSTQRAIQLRNGKGGSFGTGELVRMAGREKLELIAGTSYTLSRALTYQ